MKWILKIYLSTFSIGVIFYTGLYCAKPLTGANMFNVGVLIITTMLSIINVLFMCLAYWGIGLMFKPLRKQMFLTRYVVVEVILMYIFYNLFSSIKYEFNILPINKATENDLFRIFLPFLLLSILYIGLALIIHAKNRSSE